MSKRKPINLWFEALKLKRCPICEKDTKGPVYGWYEYISNKKRLVMHFCENCKQVRVFSILDGAFRKQPWSEAHVIGMGTDTSIQSHANKLAKEGLNP